MLCRWPIDCVSSSKNLLGRLRLWRKNETISMRETSYVDDFREAEAIKQEFQDLAQNQARLGCKGSSEDVINLMAWEIWDLRKTIARAETNRNDAWRQDE
jgi:hypothetical protein